LGKCYEPVEDELQEIPQLKDYSNSTICTKCKYHKIMLSKHSCTKVVASMDYITGKLSYFECKCVNLNGKCEFYEKKCKGRQQEEK
jgi:hypothetical protein